MPPGPRSWVPGAVFRELRKGPLEFLTKLTREHGDIASFKAVGQWYVVLNHPDLAKEVLLTQAEAFWKGPALQNSKGILGEGLLTAEGEAHRSQRKLMTPAFHAKQVEAYAGEICRSTRGVVEAWRNRVGSGEGSWDIRPEMMGLTLVIAGNALFGTMLAEEIKTVHRCMDDLMNNYVRSVVPWGWILNHLPLESTRKLKRARADLITLVERIIAQRREEMRQGVAARRDLLSMMIGATGEEAEGKSGVRLSDVQLRDQSVTILTASHETTANAMTFTLYLLAKHPEEQEKLREEVVRELGGAEPGPEVVERLVRTKWVLNESMRLLPPAWTLGRQNRREVELGGYRLPPKCTILIPQWTLHRDGRFWDEPLKFEPERWQNPVHPRYAYLPFSTGPRNCIGESFAWLEMMLALAMLVREFRFRLAEGKGELRLTPAITLRPRDPVVLQVARV